MREVQNVTDRKKWQVGGLIGTIMYIREEKKRFHE